ncbi:MAG: CBS domain-containing protein [Gammaproteobacteria bacterium]|uniref:tRNA nucleotidyltransferase, A-adding n=1 Tax=Marinobacter nitratireducens TaxID=1137280 RepID=A0A072N5K5_9GAMM|nr:CBS domain-containing protein [Marinobacter nitratireducens]KEF32532.1 tRNA nucleotidyltransferase, A-adding [Marinobacter nitratireducens]TNE82219.1 MAG: CBS domain-containing protein [Gammaproteobacteria bacterium]TNE95350.1 MAG: CBS domain-containing protein [Gammaproteobacteria bacterium]
MSIFVSEPGRPVGTRLPEVYRGRRVDDVSELTESHPINPSRSEATDAEFQQAAHSGRQDRAVAEYGAAAADMPRTERPYLPVSSFCSQALYSVSASATVSEALSSMDEHGVNHLVVMSENNVAGVVELRWLLEWLHEHQVNAMSQSLLHIELPAFLTASPETDAHQLARLMLAHRLNAALVIDANGAPAGIVSSTDYLRLYASSGRQEGAI